MGLRMLPGKSVSHRRALSALKFLCAFLPALLICPHAGALDPNKALTQYVHDVWQMEQGLSQTTVHAILQTRDGYLWLGTWGGLVRFDGVRFTVFDKQNTPEIKHNNIRCLYEDREGNLWIGTENGLSRHRDGKFTSFTTREGLTNGFVRSLHEDREGNLWIATYGGGLNRFRDGKFTTLTTTEGLSDDRTKVLHEDHEGSLWIGTADGLNRLRNGKITVFTTEDGLSDNNVRSLYEDKEGRLWIGTAAEINCFHDGKFLVFTTREGLSNDVAWSFYEDRGGSLWIGTEGGLNRLADGKFTAFTTKEQLSNDVVLSLYEDREGSLWIGTEGGGLNRLRDGKFTAFTTAEGLSHDRVWSLYEDREGSLWIGTEGGGLNRLADGKFTAITTREGLLDDRVWGLYEDREGSLWIGTEGGLNRLANGKFTAYTTKEGLASNSVWSFHEDRAGALWIGTEDGLNRLADGKFDTFTTTDGLSNNSVFSIHEDREGTFWIATDGGLNRLRNGEFTAFTTREGLSNDTVYSIHPDQEDTLWIGTDGGLNRLRNGKIIAFTTEDGLFDDVVYAIQEDNSGNLWISCNKGIFRVSKKELNDFAEGSIRQFLSVSYGTADGMKRAERRGGSWKTMDGRLWFGTVAGAVVIDPQRIASNELKPPVHVEEIIVDGNPLEGSGSVRVKPGKKDFEFHYTALSLLIPERVKFQYILEGYDEGWIDAGSRRTAYYTNIPPGNYTFRVKACNNDGAWNEEGASFAFVLLPRFYQTWWFYGLCVIAILAALTGGYQFRVGQLRKRQLELANQVREKTRELRESNETLEEQKRQLETQTQLLQEQKHQLQEAQERIAELIEPSGQALENISLWSKTVGEDIAQTIGASGISVWTVEGEELSPLAVSDEETPSYEAVKNATEALNILEDGRHTLAPVKGVTGEIYGAVVVSGQVNWNETEKRLVAGFAHQLGATLESQKMRRLLFQAEQQKATTLREMQEQGIATLQVCLSCARCFDHTAERCDTDGTELQTPRLLPYRLLDRYRLIRFLGEGGMGVVFRAIDEKLNRQVAVKIIRLELLHDQAIRARLEREANTMAKIQHQGVVSIYDVGEVPDGSPFIVMEFLEGVDLAAILRSHGPGTPAQVATVMAQVGDALKTAHERGVIHRDLKPSNLFMIHSDGGFQIKVVDFGLAKSMDEEPSLTISGTLVGSPKYMSPEQVRYLPLDARSDLFSLASVTYELLTGTAPFDAEYIPEILTKIHGDDPAPISSKLSGAPAELDDVFSEAFEKDAAKRPQNITVWIDQVRPHLLKTPSTVTGWPLELLLKDGKGS